MITDYDTAETLVLEALEGQPFPYVRSYFLLENVADSLIGLPRTATLNEFAVKHDDLHASSPEQVFEHPLDYNEAALMDLVLKKYQDFNRKVERNDNWLNPNAVFEDSLNWQAGYRNAVAGFLISEGEQAQLSMNFYGWKAYEKIDSEPVAVFHIKEHYQGEFTSTFSEPESNVGVSGEVLLANGHTVYMRWEGTFTEILSAVTSL